MASKTASLSYLRPEVAAIKCKLDQFVEEECIPAERSYEEHISGRSGRNRWTLDAIPPCMEQLKRRAQELGLWNLFIPQHLLSAVPKDLAPSVCLTYREYGILCETLGRSPNIAPEVCNTSAPDTGNMEVLMEFGTPKQRQQYLLPLLRGEIRSTFLMTEPEVASSDPTNLATKLTKIRTTKADGTTAIEYVLSGRKWWSTGAMDPRCRLALVVAKMDYTHPSLHNNDPTVTPSTTQMNGKHGAHTIVAVQMPNPGLIVSRALTLFGYDDAPHGHAEVLLDSIRLTADDLILGEGSGFRVSQARLGPGRIHHCMRAIGMASRCYELMLQRCLERKTFGKYLWEHGGTQEMIGNSVADLEAARLLTLSCADMMDRVGVSNARQQIATIKVAVPKLTYAVVDRAVQLFGGAGVSNDYILARVLIGLRSLRIADGPDAVHQRTIAQLEIKKVMNATSGNARNDLVRSRL